MLSIYEDTIGWYSLCFAPWVWVWMLKWLGIGDGLVQEGFSKTLAGTCLYLIYLIFQNSLSHIFFSIVHHKTHDWPIPRSMGYAPPPVNWMLAMLKIRPCITLPTLPGDLIQQYLFRSVASRPVSAPKGCTWTL